MIVVDVETSGTEPERNGIWQIGALDLSNPQNTFLQESRIDDEDEISEEALKVIGKTEKYLRDKNKQSQKELLGKFFNWVNTIKIKNCLCQNPQFDLAFINRKANQYGLKISFHHRAFDLHSIASIRYNQINGKLLIEEDHSGMGLTNILKFCGLEDKRIQLKDGGIVKQGKPHNALEDAKLTAECFSRLVYGKSLLQEFSKSKLPDYLLK